ncbi:MAG: hypothetical protein RLZZ206_246 [Cyanobacteriota bacterium]
MVIGLLTDLCIDHTVKDAADRGYRVACLTDTCQAETAERHATALACFQGYASLVRVDAFLALLQPCS